MYTIAMSNPFISRPFLVDFSFLNVELIRANGSTTEPMSTTIPS